MICRRCGADVAPTKFCSKCGVLLNGKRCNTCGAIMGVSESFCAECGTHSQPAQASAPVSGYYGGQTPQPAPAAPSGQQAVSLKKRPKRQPPAIMENKYIRLRGLIGGLVGFAALAVMIYFYAFGDLLSASVDGTNIVYSPIIFSAENMMATFSPTEFLFYNNFEFFIEYFKAFGANFMNVFGDSGSLTLFMASLPALLFQLAYFISALLLALAVLIAVFKFIICLIRKKEFDLMFPVQLGLVSFVSMYLALLLTGGADMISLTSGLMFGIYAGGAAIVLQILLNLGLAGRRFFRTGSVMKWITNLGFFAGALIMLFNMPLTVKLDGADVQPLSWFAMQIASLFSAEGFEINDMMVFVLMGIMAVAQIGFIWGLASRTAKAGKRAARTFKFDGYEDKGCIRKGFTSVCTAIGFGAVAWAACGELNNTIVLFAVGAVVMLVFAIINRMFLNRDQLG